MRANFLHGDAMLEVAEPGAAPFLLDGDAVEAELAELGPEVAREGIAAVDLVGARRDLVGGKAAHALAQHVGGFAEAEVEAADVIHAHVRRFRCARGKPDARRARVERCPVIPGRRM